MSNKRIQKFLNSDEIDEYVVNTPTPDADGNIITIVNGSFRWSGVADDALILKKSLEEKAPVRTQPFAFRCSINLKVRQGSLVALVGPVGSGKSSILAALLGEMSKTDGEVKISGTIAYVPQTAWIFNATLKQNILFGKEHDAKLYNQVIEACALNQDFGKHDRSAMVTNSRDTIAFRYTPTTRRNRDWREGKTDASCGKAPKIAFSFQ